MTPHKSNLERWRFYMSNVKSPDSFIDIGFYFMISSALQRRVWIPSTTPLYPNMYVILIGPAGVGKGLVLKQVASILRHHPLKEVQVDTSQYFAQDDSFGNKQAEKQKEAPKLLIPVAPDSTTFENLVRLAADSVRSIKYIEEDPQTGSKKLKLYTHNSLAFVLEELSSLFKKKADAVCNFLLNAFDCGSYEYETKTQGKDHVKKLCVNFLAGTTPTFLQESFDEKLLSDGFSSRTIFIYEPVNRFIKFKMEEQNKEQLQARSELLEHVKKLTTLYGPVSYTPEAFEVLRHHFEEVHPFRRPNTSIKLESYYARKDVHVQKLAMAIHFADKTDMTITKDECLLALDLCAKLEARMHLALDFGGRSPTGADSKKIKNFLKSNGNSATWLDIWTEFVGDIPERELQEALLFLISTKQVVQTEENKVMKYSIV